MINNFSFTYFLIALSFVFTLITYFNSNIYLFWLNNYFLNNWEYHFYFLQLFTSKFLHWDFFHFAFNTVFLYLFWTQVEEIIWRNKYILFFVFIVFFNWILITLFWWDWVNTVWISWFCMAILTYYVLQLKSINNPDYKWWVTAIIVNILIWFTPWISFLGHFMWVIWWIIFYYALKFLKK